MEAHYGRPLALLATMDGDRSTEAEIHGRFAHLRFGRTEQFKPGPDLMAFINRPLFAAAGDVVEMPGPSRDTRLVRLELSPRHHRLLRLVAADEGVSMSALARSVIEDFVEMRIRELGLLGLIPIPKGDRINDDGRHGA